MNKTRHRRLKVFQAQFGFFDSVVAAPSQAAALRAWGTHQNLFKNGQARITEDMRAAEIAIAHPETPLRRAVGSKDPFSLDPVGPPPFPAAPDKAGAPPKPKPDADPPPPPADRSELDAAESAIRKLRDERRLEEIRFRRRQDDLDAEVATSQRGYVAALKAATAAEALARQTYREAGGEREPESARVAGP